MQIVRITTHYCLLNNNSEKTEKEVKTRKTLRTETKCEQQIGLCRADCRTNAKKRKELFDHNRKARGHDHPRWKAVDRTRILPRVRRRGRCCEFRSSRGDLVVGWPGAGSADRIGGGPLAGNVRWFWCLPTVVGRGEERC